MLSRNTIVLAAAVAAGFVALASVVVIQNKMAEEEAARIARLEQLAAEEARLAAEQEQQEVRAIEGEVYYDEDEQELEDADRDNMTASDLEKLPAWAREFSKLGKEARAQFMLSFSLAKNAYARQSWAETLSLLNECEVIFDGNPNLWNLRACALFELKSYSEAEAYVNRALAYQQDDPIALLNLANLHMTRLQYVESIRTFETLRKSIGAKDNPDQYDLFTFRQLLCHLMLRQEMEARNLVADIDALHDSPLFYCAEAAFAIYKGDVETARRALDSATRIYGKSPLLQAYHKWLDQCGLRDKYMEGKETESLL